jgi:hypothetical protein
VVSQPQWAIAIAIHVGAGRRDLSTDMYAAAIPDFPYDAAVHVHYQQTKLRMKDGLPKMKDVSKELGGSGITAAE